jgi:hypothetical protein
VFIEYVVLQVCKITDPARTSWNNQNLTIGFLLQSENLAKQPSALKRLLELETKLQQFRQKLLPARNKLISHSDHSAIQAGKSLGDASVSEWQQFWLDLQETLRLLHEVALGETFELNGVAMLSGCRGTAESAQDRRRVPK